MSYESEITKEIKVWRKKILKKASIVQKASKGVQNKFNSILPAKYHKFMTETVKNMIKVVLFGSKYTTKKPIKDISLKQRDFLAQEKIKNYKTTAIIEGAGTGAGGILLGLSDFPLLLSIKIKLLYELASIYGFDSKDYKERIYILNIFQLTYSSKSHMHEVFEVMKNWDEYKMNLDDDINNLDWQKFQQEYRDYLDISKMLQLVPVIGAFVGAYANNKLVDKLGLYAMNSYRMRILNDDSTKYK